MKRVLIFFLSFQLLFPGFHAEIKIDPQAYLAPRRFSPPPRHTDIENRVAETLNRAILDSVLQKEEELDQLYLQREMVRVRKSLHEFEIPMPALSPEALFEDRILSAVNSMPGSVREKKRGLKRFIQEWILQPQSLIPYRDENGVLHVFVIFQSRKKKRLLIHRITEKNPVPGRYAILDMPKDKTLETPAAGSGTTKITVRELLEGYYGRMGATQPDEKVIREARLQFVSRKIREEGSVNSKTLCEAVVRDFDAGYKEEHVSADLGALQERDRRYQADKLGTTLEASFRPAEKDSPSTLEHLRRVASKIARKLIVYFSELFNGHEFNKVAGGKGASLGELGNIAGINVPEGIVVAAKTYREVIAQTALTVNEGGVEREMTLAQIIQSELDQINYDSDVSREEASKNIQTAFRRALAEGKIPVKYLDEIRREVEQLARRTGAQAWAVRSSGTREDLEDASSAGQQATFLNVRGIENILEKIVEDWASLWTARAIAYRNGQIIKSFLKRKTQGDEGMSDEEFELMIAALQAKGNEQLIRDLRETRDPDRPDAAIDHKKLMRALIGASGGERVSGIIQKLEEIAASFTNPAEIEIAVVVQRQIKSSRSFTMFTADAKSGWLGWVFNKLQGLHFGRARVFQIDFSYGLGEAIVGGLTNPDTFIVHKVGNRYNIVERTLGTKKFQMVYVQDLLGNAGLTLEQGAELVSAIELPYLLGRLKLSREQVAAFDSGAAPDELLRALGFKEGNSQMVCEAVEKIKATPPNTKIKIKKEILRDLSGSEEAEEQEKVRDRLISLAKAVQALKRGYEDQDRALALLRLDRREQFDLMIGSMLSIADEKEAEKIRIPEEALRQLPFDQDQIIALTHALNALTHGDYTALTFVPEELQGRFSMTDEEVIRVAKAGERIANHGRYNDVRDVEGALDQDGSVQITQARPLTTKVESDKPDFLGIVKWVLADAGRSRAEEAQKRLAGKSEEELKALFLKEGAAALTGLKIAKGLPTKNAFAGTLIHIDESKGNLAAQLSKVKKGDRAKGEGHIIYARFTSPDYVEAMKRSNGVIADEGGGTSHAAIVSRELGIATVVGIGSLPKWIKELMEEGHEIPVTVDANEGIVYLGKLQTRETILEILISKLKKLLRLKIGLIGSNPAAFREISKIAQYDGHYGVSLVRLEFILAEIGVHPRALIAYDHIRLMKKVQNEEMMTLDEIATLAELDADKGLVEDIRKLEKDKEIVARIEDKIKGYPSGQEYFKMKIREGLSSIAGTMGLTHEVVVRSLDFKSNELSELIGGKLYEPAEFAPMLGDRGVQREIDPSNQRIFKLQIEAFQEARDSGYINLSLMLPFVRHPEHLEKAIQILKRVRFQPKSFGIMAELPNNVWMVDRFAEILKRYQAETERAGRRMGVFFSFGTNDLTQLTLGTGRDAGRLKKVFYEGDPAVIRSIIHVSKAAKRHGIKLGLCGNAVNRLIETVAALGVEKEKLDKSAEDYAQRAAEIDEEIADAERAIQTIFGLLDSVGVDISNYPKAVEIAAKYESGLQNINLAEPEIKIPAAEPEPVESLDFARHEMDELWHAVNLHPNLLLDYDAGRLEAQWRETVRGVVGDLSGRDYLKKRIREGLVQKAMKEKTVVHGTSYMYSRDPAGRSFAGLQGAELYPAHEDNPPLDFNGMSRNLDPEYRDLFRAEMEAVREAAEHLEAERAAGKKPGRLSLQLNSVRTLKELDEALRIILAEAGVSRETVAIGLGVQKASNAVVIEEMLDRGLKFVHLNAMRVVQEMFAGDITNKRVALTQQQADETIEGPRRVIKEAARQRNMLYLVDAASRVSAGHGRFTQTLPFKQEGRRWGLLLDYMKRGGYFIPSVEALDGITQQLEEFVERHGPWLAEEAARETARTISELTTLLDQYYSVYELARHSTPIRDSVARFMSLRNELIRLGVYSFEDALVATVERLQRETGERVTGEDLEFAVTNGLHDLGPVLEGLVRRGRLDFSTGRYSRAAIKTRGVETSI